MALSSLSGLIGGAIGGGVIGRAVVELVGDSTRLRGDVARAQTETTAATNQMGASASRFSGVYRTAMLAAGAAAAMAAVQSVRAWIEFDDKMTQSLAIMGDVSDRMRTDMETAAREVAKTTTFSAAEAAEAYFFLASAGMDAAASIEALPAVAQFAQAGLVDLATATDLLTDAQSALGLTIREDAVANMENMVRVSDVLVRANQMANASVEQFALALTSKAAAAMRTANMEVEEGVAVLAAFADQGLKGAAAGERFSILLRDLPRAVAKNREEFEALNIEIVDGEGNLLNMADVVDNLTAVLGPMSDTARAAAFETLGLTRGVSDATRQLLGIGPLIRIYEEGLWRAAGATDEVANKQLESLKNQLELAKSAVSDLGLTLGSGLEPAVKGAADALQAFADVAGPAIEVLQLLNSLGGEGSGVFDRYLKVVQSLVPGWGGFSSPALEAARALGLVGEETEEAADAAEGSIDPFSKLTDTVLGLGVKFMLAEQQVEPMTQTMIAQAEAARDLRDAHLALAGGVLAIESAAQSAGDAQRAHSRAQATVNKLVEDGKKGTPEYREALRDLRSAQLASTQAQLSLGEAVTGFVDKVKDGELTQRDAIGLVREYGRMAGLSQGEIRGLIDRVRDLIGEYRNLPTEKKTEIKATTGAALADIAHFNRTLDAATRTRTVAINVVAPDVSHVLRSRGMAEGGVIGLQHGGVVRSPTFLVGEGTRRTFAGPGAEAVLPLTPDVLRTIGREMAREVVRSGPARSEGVSGAPIGSQPLTLFLELDGVTLEKSVRVVQDRQRVVFGGRR